MAEEADVKTKNSIDMLNGPLVPKLIRFAVPLMLSGVLQLLFNAVDVVVVGQYCGDESLAAVGSTGSLINLITNLFIGFSVGANVVMARSIGANRRDKAERVLHTSMLLSAIAGAVILLVGVLLSRQMLELMNSPEDVIDKSTLYLEIYFVGSPAVMIYNFGAALLRAKGDTKRPMIFLIISGIINAGLNLVFVICFKMDVMGVALATVISQVLSAALVVICLLREKDVCKLRLRKLRICKKELGEIIRVGLPTGVYSSFFSLANIIVQSGVNSMGKIVIAGNAASGNIEGFVYTIMYSFSHAATTFVSQNCAACKPERVKRTAGDVMLLAVAFGLAFGLLVLLLGRPLCRLYSPDPAVIEVALERMRVILPTYFLCGLMDSLVGVLRGMGYYILPMCTSLVFACLLRVVWVYTVFAAVPTTAALYSCFPITWFLAAAVNFIIMLVKFKPTVARMMKQVAPADGLGSGSVADEIDAAAVDETVSVAAEVAASADSEIDPFAKDSAASSTEDVGAENSDSAETK